MKYRIATSFTVYYDIEVEGDTFEEARDKLVGRHIFSELERISHNIPINSYGLREDVMDHIGAKVVDEDYDCNPSPSDYTRPPLREWDYVEVSNA